MEKRWGAEDKTMGAGAGDAVTPNDSADLPSVARALYIGATGTLVVILEHDTVALTFNNIPAGYNPLRVRRVLTGTTATGLIALY